MPQTALHRTPGTASVCLVFISLVVFCGNQAGRADENLFSLPPGDEPTLLTGRAFERALNGDISLAWQDQRLRDGLRKLTRNREIAILLDRRIDPDVKLTLQLKNVTLRDLLGVIASEADAELSVLENVVYIGPPETARRLRTVVEIISTGLPGAGDPQAGRSFELLKRRTLTWQDLDDPAAMLQRVGDSYGLGIMATRPVPHDLWAAGQIPDVSATVALLVVLSQFDLSFEWTDDWSGIRVVPLPESPRIERTFSIRRGSTTQLAAKLDQSLPGLSVKARGSRNLQASGTVEQLEQVDRVLHPERYATQRPGQRPKTGEVIFTFEVKNAPLIAVMTRLEEQAGFNFNYDATAIANAGIDVESVINLNLNKASEDELLEAMFKDTGLSFERDGKTVRVFPDAAQPQQK